MSIVWVRGDTTAPLCNPMEHPLIPMSSALESSHLSRPPNEKPHPINFNFPPKSKW